MELKILTDWSALWKEICCQNVYTILIPNSNLYLISTQRRWRLWRNNEIINVARVHWEHCILITLITEPFLDAVCFFHNIFLRSQYEEPKKSMQQLLPAKLYYFSRKKPSKLQHLISLHMSRNRSPSKKACFPLINCFYYLQVLETMDTTGKQINPNTAPC